MRPPRAYRQTSLRLLDGNWIQAIISTLILIGVNFLIHEFESNIASYILFLAISFPFSYGFNAIYLEFIEKNKIDLNLFISGFKNYLKVFATGFIAQLFITLWAILLIIPGIVAAYSYSMIFFILKENPDMDPFDVLKKSKNMMYGYKNRLFSLHISFIGWGILSILTLGIGFLWLIPYVSTAHALFYDDLKKERGIIPESPDEDEEKVEDVNEETEKPDIKLDKGEEIVGKL